MEFLKTDDTEASGVQVPVEVPPPEDREIFLSDYLKAGYSFIHVRTEEDPRARLLIKNNIARLTGAEDVADEYWEWSSTKGLQKFLNHTTNTPDVTNAGLPIPDALSQMLDHDGAVICVFYNIRQFMEMPVIVQKFKDAADECRMIGSTIFVVGPRFNYPPELENEITVWDLDLPTSEQFYQSYQNLASVYKNDIGEVEDDTLRIAAASAVGMTEIQGENSIALSLAKYKSIDPTLIQNEKEQIIKKSDTLSFMRVEEGMDSLGGFDVLKKWIAKRKNVFTPEAREFGVKPLKGILMVGLPGLGKSKGATTIAHYLGLPLLRFDLGSVFRGLQGGSEKAVRDAIKTIEAVAPCCVLMDEIEKATAGSQSSGKTDGGTTARVMGTILSWMSDMTKNIFIIATANNPQNLPAEMMRKGRFSEIWGVVEPEAVAREEIWRIHIDKVRPGLEVDMETLVDVSKRYVGAEIESAVEDAMISAYADGKKELSTEYFVKSLQSMKPQCDTSKESLDVLREWMSGRVRYVESASEKESKNIFDTAGKSNRKLRLEEN